MNPNPPISPKDPIPVSNGDTGELLFWMRTALIALFVIAATVPMFAVKERVTRTARRAAKETATDAAFVGREKCIGCHEEAFAKWTGSHHDLAMDVASDTTVLGDFDSVTFEHGGVASRFYKRDNRYFVHTQGPGGEMGEFEITHTFGTEPLQQYLIPLAGGRLQALTTAWDTERHRWFTLYPDQDIPPDDWLHWTRAGQNWNGMCAECHSTNLVKGYDPGTQTFHTTWSEIDVSCEACHGPASRHIEWAEIQPMARPDIENYGLVVATSGITNEEQVELCAPCHSRRTQFGDYDHTQGGPLDNLVPAVLTEDLYYADGQILEEVYVYGSFLQSKMFTNDVRCTDCHDAHSLALKEKGNALCLQCHQADAYDTYDHHFHKKIHEGKPSDGALCIKCHMPERPYMVIDWRADHSIRVPRPDLTRDIHTPSACDRKECHENKTLEWLNTHYTEWYGRARKSHYGRTLYAGRRLEPDARGSLVKLAGDELYPAIVRATALSLLGAYPGEESTRAFNMALTDPDALVRYTAVQNVNVADSHELIELIAPLLFDPARAVRGQVATRLVVVPDEALKSYQREALQTALLEYRKAMEYSLDFAFAGHNLGNLYANLGKRDSAEVYYKTAIEIDDLFYPAKVNLAMLYNQMGKNREAERLFREVLSTHPDMPEMNEVAYSLALLMAEMERYEEAVGLMRYVTKRMPGASRVHYNLGLALQKLGRDGEAETALLKALELEPSNYDYLYALSDHYVKRGRFEEALLLAEKMMAMRPDLPAGQALKSFIEKALQNPTINRGIDR